jgi:hypothetical protein
VHPNIPLLHYLDPLLDAEVFGSQCMRWTRAFQGATRDIRTVVVVSHNLGIIEE